MLASDSVDHLDFLFDGRSSSCARWSINEHHSICCNGAGSKCTHHLDLQDVDESTNVWEFEMMAQHAAEDYWNDHDGCKSRWSLDLELFVDGGSVGVFEMGMEM